MTMGRYTVPTCMNVPGLFSSALKRICFLGRWICEDDRVSQLLSHFADQLVPPGAGSEGRGGIQRSEDDFKLGSSLVPFLKVGWSSRNIRSFDPGTYDFTDLYFIHLIDAVLPFFVDFPHLCAENRQIPNLMPMLLRDGELFWNPTVRGPWWNKRTFLGGDRLRQHWFDKDWHGYFGWECDWWNIYLGCLEVWNPNLQA